MDATTVKKLRRIWVWTALGCASVSLAPVHAHAQGFEGRMSLRRAQQLSEEHAPAVTLAVSRATTAQADVAVAGMLPNPRVTLGTTSGTAQVYAYLYVTLPVFGQRGTAITAADAQARVASAGIEVARLDARLAATMAWIAVWQLDAELSIAGDNAARRERVVQTARARFSEGAAPRLDVLRAQTDARRTRAEVNALSQQRTAAVTRLLVLLGLPLEDAAHASIEGDPRLVDALPTASRCQTLIAQHPMTRRARALVHAADAVVARERRARWPLLAFQLSGNFLERQPPPANYASLGLTVELPIFNRPLITRAQRARASAQTELDTLQRQLEAQLAAARAEYQAAARRQRAQLDQVRPAAQEAAELSLEAYQSGGLDLTGTLAAEQTLADATLTAAGLTADRARALALLEHAAGSAL